MASPLVTVFMAVYNVENFIKESIESVINQSYENLELLIVNDASTDRSPEILHFYEKQDKRIRVIHNEKNMGIPYTRNIGLKEAKGKYIAIIDSDDITFPRRIEKQVIFMENNPEIDVLGTDYEVFGGRVKRTVRNKCLTSDELKIKFLFNCAIHNPTAMLRKKTLDDYDLNYNLKYFVASDYALFSQLSKVGKVAILPEVHYMYRIGHSNITKKSLDSKLSERKQILYLIQKDILNYYNFELSVDELEIYNTLFFDNPSREILSDTFFEKLIKMLEKLEVQNNQMKIFENALFGKVLLDSVRVAISNLNIGLAKKIRVYSNICTSVNSKSVLKHKFYLISKSIYYSFIAKARV